MNKNLIYKRINVDLICYLFFILGINICVVSAGSQQNDYPSPS